jgi:hypothetical protein
MDSIKLFFDIYAAANDCNKTKTYVGFVLAYKSNI